MTKQMHFKTMNYILQIIYNSNNCTPAYLRKKLSSNLSLACITLSLKLLEKHNFIVKEKVGRKRITKLTDLGKDLTLKLMELNKFELSFIM